MAFGQQREDYFGALGWVGDLMGATSPSQLDDPTSCAEFSVRLLMGQVRSA